MASASLHLPLVAWHQYINHEKVTCLTFRYPFVYIGQSNGHIWVYTLTDTQFQAKFLFTGHTQSVTALCVLETKPHGQLELTLVSADASGEIAKWNVLDGRCQLVNNILCNVPTQLKVFSQLSDEYIYCCGQCSEIYILSASTLEVVRVWGGHPNWVVCTSYFDPLDQRTRLMTCTTDGQLDRWDVDLSNMTLLKVREDIKHNMTQIVECGDSAVDLMYDPSLSLLILVTRHKVLGFQLDGEHKEYVLHFPLHADEQDLLAEWAGAHIIDSKQLFAWTNKGNVSIYQLEPPNCANQDTLQNFASANLISSYTLLDDSCCCMTVICPMEDRKIALLTLLNRDDSNIFCLDRILLSTTSSAKAITRDNAQSLASIWPIQPTQNESVITTTIPVSSNHLAIGYASGTITVIPLSIAMLSLNEMPKHIEQRQDTRIFERAHDGKVTCLLVPDHVGSDPKHLLSGGRDGCVKIWNLINGKFVASFAAHASPIKSFVEPAEQCDAKIRSCVVSIAYDNSIALISVESMTCLYIIPGYQYPLTWIQWRAAEDLVLLGYGNGSVSVWELQAGYLDRMLDSKTSRLVKQDDRWPINYLDQPTSRKQNANLTVQARSVTSTSSDMFTKSLMAQVFTVNIRRLAFELKQPNEAYAKQLQIVPSMSTSSMDTHSANATVPILSPPPQPSSSSLFIASMSSPNTNASHYAPEKLDPLDIRLDDDLDNAQIGSKRNDHRLAKRELGSAVMSALLTKGIEPSLESHCQQQWMMPDEPSRQSGLSFAIKGPQSYMSMLVPTQDQRQSWSNSATVTAMRLLSIAFLMDAVDADGTTMGRLASYFAALPDKVGPSWISPSLPFLCRHWQDEKARRLFSFNVTQLDEASFHDLVNYWRTFLPISSTKNDADMQAMMTRATIVLGLIGCDNPGLLEDSVRKDTALSLTLLLSDGDIMDMPVTHSHSTTSSSTAGTAQTGSSSHTTGVTSDMSMQLTKLTASMQLLSEGCQTWETYINTSNVLRTIFAYASSNVTAKQQATGSSGTASQSPATSSMTLTGETLPLLAAMPVHLRQTVRQYAKQAIFTFARNDHVPLVIGTLIYDIIHTKSIHKCLGHLSIISSFTRKNPMLIYGHVHQVIEAVVKTLDPNVPHMRESVVQSATSIIHDLVKIYPIVDFSHGSQKLIVGTPEGATIVYDLLTATRSAVFEGHTGSISAVKFSPDTKFVATCSLGDSTVRVWYTSVSLLGMFTSSFQSQGSRHGGISSQKSYKIFSFALPDTIGNDPASVNFEWPSNRCVKLLVKEAVMSFNV
ncbi:WD40 repeat-like protein [Hesseltinella vesiculosa]|uniref:WD40 repeat-like protein n=1 Tax=Hesseltinella vesiculosa TaxID=101127 RepID=A0A1X2GG45_9FUNG|nr:WD40 repeat-like protein [Hesseltinella vesiculosa]